jgi:hypothetical protein
MNPLTQGVALGYKYYALSGHVFVRLNGSDAPRGNAVGTAPAVLRCDSTVR